jgi:adenosylcobinamide kinase/adenosylcobinamide-phosphate guanylyltransferase
MTTTLPLVTLVLGGTRSGKSRHAETLVEAQPGACIYLATAEPGDEEMAERIRRHRARRGARWQTLEEPLELAGALRRAARPDGAVLVDCLTLWLSNLLGAARDVGSETQRLVAALPELAGPAGACIRRSPAPPNPCCSWRQACRSPSNRLHDGPLTLP